MAHQWAYAPIHELRLVWLRYQSALRAMRAASNFCITMPEITRERMERILDTMRARNPDIADRHLLTFLLEMGLIHAEQIYRLPPLEPKAPSGVFTITEEEQ